MPRYFCDYCDAYLTHDSAPGRQQHIRGNFFKINAYIFIFIIID